MTVQYKQPVNDQLEWVFPFAAPATLEPPPEYAWLRAEAPITRVNTPYGHVVWLVTRYADVRAVLADNRFGRTPLTAPDAPRINPLPAPGASILSADLPEHSRLRRLVAGAFSVRRIEQLRPHVEQITARLLDELADSGPPADLVAGLTLPLPVTVICELLGVPYADRERFGVWARTLQSLTAHTAEEMVVARQELGSYLADLIETKRREPSDDLLGYLVGVRDEQEDMLTEAELITFGATLVLAGHETTANHLADAVVVLLRYPEQAVLLRERPELIPTAVEELLRYAPTDNGSLLRIALQDVELGGKTIRAGEAVCAAEMSANRDETVFPDADQLDITRTDNPHLSFGHGIHRCLGAQLGRMEMQVALAALLDRFPGLRLAVPEEHLTWRRGGLLLRGPQALPVTW
jgi:cytochrome P450